MLTAQKENSPLDTELLTQRPPSARSFDRVVTSIEGLRERVQGFTLEQVSEVDQRLRTMSLQLGELQRTVRALAEMKQRMGRLQKAVQQAEAESLERSRLATLVEPIAAHSIARVGTLLKFQRVIKLLKEAKSGSGVSVSADAEAKTPPLPTPLEVIPASPKNERELGTDLPAIRHDLPERSASETSVVAASEAPDESEAVLHTARAKMDFEPLLPKLVEIVPAPSTNGQQLATDLPAIEHELPERSANETTVDVSSEYLEQTEATLHAHPVEMDFEPNEPFSHEPGNAIFDESTSIEPREIVAEFADTREEPPANHEAIFEEFKGTGDMEVHLAIPETETVETTGQTHTAASEEADFDQRLLDDLIKDYGEFTILPSSTPKPEAKKKPKPEPTPATPRVKASAPVIPATQPNLPSPRKDGELDRKLKKLIKDYGEYDLYSRQTPLKLKTGVLAAFLVLTLIFSGFYFFSSPKPAVPASASSASQSQSSSEAAPKEPAPNAETNSGETLSPPSVSNVGLPKPVEAGASQNVANKVTKKTTK
jgi:hypothetical protein